MSENSQIEYFEKTPFKEPLITVDRGSNIITRLRSDPEKIVRIQDDPVHEFGTEQDLVERIKHTASLFSELSNEYGVNVVKHSSVIGHDINPDSDTDGFLVYTVAERIDGTALDHVDLNQVNRDKFLAQVSQLYENLIRFHTTNYKNGKDTLGDITSAQQYMYGRRKGETEDKIYLVDVGTMGSNNPDTVLPEIFEIAYSITDLESNLGIDLTKVKQKLKTEIEALAIDGKFAKARLDGKERALKIL